MSLESGDFIADLNANNPLGSDPKSEGDDHLRLVKRCTQGSFPAFVGTTAVPKSVTLTEDQINDAALKSAANTFSGVNTFGDVTNFNAAAALANNIAVTGGLQAGVGSRNLLHLDTADRVIFGDSNAQIINFCATQNQFLVDGVTVAFMVALNSGGIQVKDRNGNSQKVGFRFGPPVPNPSTIIQDYEGKVLAMTGATARNWTIDQLEEGTAILISNQSSASQILTAGTASLSWIDPDSGGGGFPTLNLASNSIVQLWWRAAGSVNVWGNGISG